MSRSKAAAPVVVEESWYSVYSEIVKPKEYVSMSGYYIRHWLPKITENGHKILTVLRGMGYIDVQKGIKREQIDVDQKQLAQMCGLSVRTLQRTFDEDAVLAKFVQRELRQERNRFQQIMREHYIYRVRMDEPLTDEDQAVFDAKMRAHLDAQNEPKNETEMGPEEPIRQNGVSEAEPIRQIDVPIRQFVVPIRQNGVSINKVYSLLRILKTTKKRTPKQTLNVGPGLNKVEANGQEGCSVDEHPPRADAASKHGKSGKPASDAEPPLPSPTLWEDALTREAEAIVAELSDFGSERRHRQLLSICDQHGLQGLPQRALQETRKRLSQERRHGVLEKPGAYYQRVLLAFLEARQVFVPKLSELGEDDPAEVRRLIQASLGGGLGAGLGGGLEPGTGGRGAEGANLASAGRKTPQGPSGTDSAPQTPGRAFRSSF